MIRKKLVEECFLGANAWRPGGPWIFVIVDRDLAIVDEAVFRASQSADARSWLLERVQQADRIPAFRLAHASDADLGRSQ
jgi:hypothetical protein